MPDPQSAWTAGPAPADAWTAGPAPTSNAVSPSPWWQAHPKTLQAARGAVDAIPAVGAMTGMALTTPETLGVGTTAGAVAGVAAGRLARDYIAESLGIESPTSPLSKTARIALDSAVTAAAPTIASRAKEVLLDPKGSLADVIDMFAHPGKTYTNALDMVADYLRAVPKTASTIMPTYPPELGDGLIAQGLVENQPSADIAATQTLIKGGMSPSTAAAKATSGSLARFSAVMAHFMKTGGAK